MYITLLHYFYIAVLATQCEPFLGKILRQEAMYFTFLVCLEYSEHE